MPDHMRQMLFVAVFALWLVPLTVSVGCKKKDHSPDSQQVNSFSDLSRSSAEKRTDGLTGKGDLRLLYVGIPGSDREKDFVKFLTQYYLTVENANYESFSENQARGFDVVIFDYDGTSTQSPMPHIPSTFSQATITMGVPGADISSRLNLKTGYL